MGWRARLTPFEVPKGGGVGQPFIERVELEIWWMSGTQRHSFRLEGFHRALLTTADLAAVRLAMSGNACGARTLACRVHTRVNARKVLDAADYFADATKRSHECERGTQECVRHDAGVTLIELLIAVLLLSLLSVGIVLTLRVALSAMNKSDSKLMANRRVSSVERILDQEIEGIMPVTADCQPQPGVTGTQADVLPGRIAIHAPGLHLLAPTG